MVYLLHFDKPLAHARHYMGYAEDLERRLKRHARGEGARRTQVLVEQGIGWRLARVWPGDRKLERRLKNRKSAPKLCPLCSRRSD